MREDLKYTAYAVAKGFSVTGPGGIPLLDVGFDADGEPHCPALEFHKGEIVVSALGLGGWATTHTATTEETINHTNLHAALLDAIERTGWTH